MNRKRKSAGEGPAVAAAETPTPEPPGNAEMASASTLAQLQDVRVMVSMELGRTEKTLNEILDLGEQSLIELNRRVGEPIDILLNGKLFARGEVVTVSENFGVRVTEILGREPEGK